KSLLIGESASPELETTIRSAILDGPEVNHVIHLRTLHLGPDDVLLATKLDFDVGTVPDLARAIDVVEARIRAAAPRVRLIFVAPDLYRPGEPEEQSPA